MARPKSQYYWTEDTEKYFWNYCKTKDNEVWDSHLYIPIRKISEVMIVKCLTPISNEEKEIVVNDLIGHLILNLHQFNPKRGKAYSWISIIFKHYVWNVLKNRRKYNNNFVSAEELPNNESFDKEIMVNNLPDNYEVDSMTYTEDEIEELSKMVIEFYTDERLKWYFRTQEKMNTQNARMSANKLLNNIRLFLIDKKAKRKRPRKAIMAQFIKMSGWLKDNVEETELTNG